MDKGYLLQLRFDKDSAAGLSAPKHYPNSDALNQAVEDAIDMVHTDSARRVEIVIQKIWKRVDESQPQVGDEIYLTVKEWIANEKDLASRELRGTLVRETEKAILFEGSASIRESRWCLRCGREITNLKSIWCGYGPVCSEKIGIPRPELLSKADRQEILDGISELIPKYTMWFPKSQVEEMRKVEAGEPNVVANVDAERMDQDEADEAFGIREEDYTT